MSKYRIGSVHNRGKNTEEKRSVSNRGKIQKRKSLYPTGEKYRRERVSTQQGNNTEEKELVYNRRIIQKILFQSAWETDAISQLKLSS